MMSHLHHCRKKTVMYSQAIPTFEYDVNLLAGIQLPKTNQKSSLKVQYHLRETARN